MPNGGPDCCGNCAHNRAVQEMAHPHPEQRKRFRELSHCTLRDVPIKNPFWTYCKNFGYGKRPEDRNRNEPLVGGITASGLYEGYVRIPWHGNTEPRVAVLAACAICGRKTPEGITIVHEGQRLGFCTNRHYVQWWRTLHADESFVPEHYQSPEDRYRDK
jgi:hypothetical protein